MNAAAILLPGQGSQFVGMGLDLAETDGAIRDLYLQADDLLETKLSRLCWEGPEEELRATENAQPAILLHSYAVWRLIGDSCPATVLSGHSLGEFTAHLLAGTFDFETALGIVRSRGCLMARAGRKRPGTMQAVMGIDSEEVKDLCAEVTASLGGPVVVAANLNAHNQTAISGDVEAVEAAGQRAGALGARVVPLKVSGAFHSPLMEETRDRFAGVLAGANIADPEVPVVANATADPVWDAATAKDTLVRQLTSPVRWTEVLDRMSSGWRPEAWLELGPGKVLAGLARRWDRGVRVRSIGDADAIDRFLAAA